MHLTQRQGAVDQVIQDVGNVVVHGVDTRYCPATLALAGPTKSLL